MRVALLARPRKNFDFKPGGSVAYLAMSEVDSK